MARCASCNTVVTRHDVVCYGCGDVIPESNRRFSMPAPKRISKISNVIFFISLGFTGFSFLSDRKLPLSISIGLSVVLFLVRVVADHFANKDADSAAEGVQRLEGFSRI